MALTKKDYEAASRDGERLLTIVRRLEPVVLPLLWLVTRPGFIRRRFDRTLPARIGRISRLAERGEHGRAAELAIETLEGLLRRSAARGSSRSHEHWWFFMQAAAENLDELEGDERRRKLIAMASAVERPLEDYHAAVCFLTFARWRYQAGDGYEAMALAEIAAGSDPTWAEPDFLLGWYSLVLGRPGALGHLTDAVRKDARVLFRIANDPVCRRHPHIIASLKTRSAASLVTQGPGRPAARPGAHQGA